MIAQTDSSRRLVHDTVLLRGTSLEVGPSKLMCTPNRDTESDSLNVERSSRRSVCLSQSEFLEGAEQSFNEAAAKSVKHLLEGASSSVQHISMN
jgi:hypothetical protein